MSIYTRIYRAVSADPEASAIDVAEAVFRQSTKGDLLPLIAAEVRREQRKRVRTVEQRHGVVMMNHYRKPSAPISERVTLSSSSDLVGRLRTFMEQPIRLFDGTSTTWGKATLEELRQRREELQMQRAGIDESIRLLDDAIDVLLITKAKCLEDISEGVAV